MPINKGSRKDKLSILEHRDKTRAEIQAAAEARIAEKHKGEASKRGHTSRSGYPYSSSSRYHQSGSENPDSDNIGMVISGVFQGFDSTINALQQMLDEEERLERERELKIEMSKEAWRRMGRALWPGKKDKAKDGKNGRGDGDVKE